MYVSVCVYVCTYVRACVSACVCIRVKDIEIYIDYLVLEMFPYFAIIHPYFQAILSSLMTLPGNMSSLMNFFSFLEWFWHATNFLALIVMRFTRKNMDRPYKVGSFFVVIVGFICE